MAPLKLQPELGRVVAKATCAVVREIHERVPARQEGEPERGIPFPPVVPAALGAEIVPGQLQFPFAAGKPPLALCAGIQVLKAPAGVVRSRSAQPLNA